MTSRTPTRPPLERWFERVFADDAPAHLGRGWLSGTLSVFLGAIGLGAVAALHFPWLDRLFRTYHMPGDTWREQLGLPDRLVPEGFVA
ncbi:MAG TPA: hypothetical protein VMT29_01640 [Steroidobacteraceae bacterium]|nr:hypothetical protein [Steroidobacteraceae bacterium]